MTKSRSKARAACEMRSPHGFLFFFSVFCLACGPSLFMEFGIVCAFPARTPEIRYQKHQTISSGLCPLGPFFKMQILYEFVIRVGRRKFRIYRWSSLLLLLLMLLFNRNINSNHQQQPSTICSATGHRPGRAFGQSAAN